ncbi:MAG: hypothetical protein R2710_25625 [Acidimicrobiales bacterium]
MLRPRDSEFLHQLEALREAHRPTIDLRTAPGEVAAAGLPGEVEANEFAALEQRIRFPLKPLKRHRRHQRHTMIG